MPEDKRMHDLDSTESQMAKRKKVATARPPSYVITMPVVSPDNLDGESSEDEDLDLTPLPSDQFQRPQKFYRMRKKATNPSSEPNQHPNNKKGTLNAIELPAGRKLPLSPKNPLPKIIEKLEKESFNPQGPLSVPKAKERISATLFLNRMQSLSKRNNRSILKYLNENIPHQIPIAIIAATWEGLWEKFENGHWVKTTYQEVRAFYSRLKHEDPEKAEQFRAKIEEGKKKYHMVPFRALRNTLKDHELTKQLIDDLRAKTLEDAPVYLTVMDADFVALNGVFSLYDQETVRHFNQYQVPLHLFSSGYQIQPNPQYSLSHVGIRYDMEMRRLLAKNFIRSVYFPEPASIILILKDAPTVEEHFQDQACYGFGSEMSKIAEDIIQKRGLNPQTTMAFKPSISVTTATAKRMRVKFEAFIGEDGLIHRWSLSDLLRLREVAQSHYNIKLWLDQVIKSLDIKGKMTITYKNRAYDISLRVRKEMIKSLLARFFSSYDVVRIAEQETKNNPQASFQNIFIELLNSPQLTEGQVLPIDEKEHKDKTYQVLWSDIVGIRTTTQIKIFLKLLIGSDALTDSIELLVQEIGNFFKEEYKKSLCLDYESLSISSMLDMLQHITGATPPAPAQFPPVIKKIIAREFHNKKHALDPADRELIRKKQKNDYLDALGAMPLHWAAITGNLSYVQALLRLKRENLEITNLDTPMIDATTQQNSGILPIHAAIFYCKKNGWNSTLVRALATANAIKSKTSDNKSTLLHALESIKEAHEFIDMYIALAKPTPKELDLLDQLKHILEVTSMKQRSQIHYKLLFSKSHVEFKKRILQYLFDLGVDFNKPCFQQGYRVPTYPVFAAIALNDAPLMEFLIDKGVRLSGIYDENGNTPLLAALENPEITPLHFSRWFIDREVDVQEMSRNNKTCPLLEIVYQLSNLRREWFEDTEDADCYLPYTRAKQIFLFITKAYPQDPGLLNNHSLQLALRLAIHYRNWDAAKVINDLNPRNLSHLEKKDIDLYNNSTGDGFFAVKGVVQQYIRRIRFRNAVLDPDEPPLEVLSDYSSDSESQGSSESERDGEDMRVIFDEMSYQGSCSDEADESLDEEEIDYDECPSSSAIDDEAYASTAFGFFSSPPSSSQEEYDSGYESDRDESYSRPKR